LSAGLLIAVGLGLYYNWKLGLVCTALFPLLLLGTFFELKISLGVDSLEKTAFEASSKLAIEAITNIRTVAGLGAEAHYAGAYVRLLAAPHRLALVRAHKRGFIFGFSQAAQFFGWGVTTWYGGVLVVKECMRYKDVYLVTNAIVGGAGMIGYSFAFTADFNKALLAASRVFQLLDRRPQIDGSSAAGLQVEKVGGNVGVSEVGFSYPTR
jgi:ATP-binding cassette subfamily B (MDR/TAP) protein 1